MRIDEIFGSGKRKKEKEAAAAQKADAIARVHAHNAKPNAREALHKETGRATKALSDEVSKNAKKAGVDTDKIDADKGKHVDEYRKKHGTPKSRKDYEEEGNRLAKEIGDTSTEMVKDTIGTKVSKKTGQNSRPESRVTK